MTKELPKLEDLSWNVWKASNSPITQQDLLTEKINQRIRGPLKSLSELNEKYRKKGEYEKLLPNSGWMETAGYL